MFHKYFQCFTLALTIAVDLDILDDKISTECSKKLFCMLYGSKKEFDNLTMLYNNKKVAVLFTVRYEGKCVL